MGDLISRSAYKEKLKNELMVLTKELHEAVQREDEDLVLAIKNQQSAYERSLWLLDDMPTAYDVEAKVAELENIKTGGDCRHNCKHYDWSVGWCEGHCEDYVREKAISIVRGKEQP